MAITTKDAEYGKRAGFVEQVNLDRSKYTERPTCRGCTCLYKNKTTMAARGGATIQKSKQSCYIDKGTMEKKIKMPRVRRAAVRTWSGLKATKNKASRAWRDAKANEKRPT